MNRRVFHLVGVALGGMFLAATAWAQDSSATIEATGTQRVRVQPKAVRLVFQIQANGKTAEEAVQQLQAQRETAVKKLKELGAEEDSIHSTPAALDSGIPGPPVFYPNPTPSYGIPGSTSSSSWGQQVCSVNDYPAKQPACWRPHTSKSGDAAAQFPCPQCRTGMSRPNPRQAAPCRRRNQVPPRQARLLPPARMRRTRDLACDR